MYMGDGRVYGRLRNRGVDKSAEDVTRGREALRKVLIGMAGVLPASKGETVV